MNVLPLISIIVPVYRVEHYLRACMDSIVNQTYANLEIICVRLGRTFRHSNGQRENMHDNGANRQAIEMGEHVLDGHVCASLLNNLAKMMLAD